MLKNILNLNGATELTKQEQQTVLGQGPGNGCDQFHCEVCLCGQCMPNGECLHPVGGCGGR